MKLRDLFERSIASVTQDDIEKFSKYHTEPDIPKDAVEPEMFMKVKKNLMKNIRGGKINLYRAIMLIGDLDNSLNTRLGMHWSYDKETAMSLRDQSGGHGEEYILEIEINEQYVNWDATIALATIKVRSNYEREIRLYKNTPVKIINIYKDGKKIDITSIKGKMFKT